MWFCFGMISDPKKSGEKVEHPAQPSPPLSEERSSLVQRHRLLVYIGKRLAALIATVIVASALTYTAIMVLPGDVVTAVLGKNATPEQVAVLRESIEGGQGVVARYFGFLGGFVHGDFGYSTAGLVNGQKIPVSDLIGPAMKNSLILAGIALVLFLPLMFILGLTAGLKPGSRRDTIISSSSLAVGALPEYFVAAVLIAVFFNQLDWFPPVSSIGVGTPVLDAPDRLVLPIVTLLMVSLAFGSRQLRSSVANILTQDYVTFAELNGFSRRKIIRSYILPNAIGPTVQIVAQQMLYLLTGIVIVETVFNYPGIGNLFVRSINAQDIQMTLVIATILAVVGITINLLADVIALLVDPVVRTSL